MIIILYHPLVAKIKRHLSHAPSRQVFCSSSHRVSFILRLLHFSWFTSPSLLFGRFLWYFKSLLCCRHCGDCRVIFMKKWIHWVGEPHHFPFLLPFFSSCSQLLSYWNLIWFDSRRLCLTSAQYLQWSCIGYWLDTNIAGWTNSNKKIEVDRTADVVHLHGWGSTTRRRRDWKIGWKWRSFRRQQQQQ